MTFGRLGSLGAGLGRLGAIGSGARIPQPNAPILAMDPAWTSADATPDFKIFVDNTIGAGDDVRLQIQVAGGDWSSPVSDTTHTITLGEDGANEIDLSLGALSNNDYEARALVNNGSDSDWSNIESFTVAAAGVSSGLYMYPYLGV